MTSIDRVVSTEHLVLRGWTEEDVVPLFTMCSNDEVAWYLGWKPSSPRDAEELVADFNSREATLGVTTWAVEERDTHTLVGWCGYARTNAAWLSPSVVEVGWMLDRNRWGEGLATEAGRAALEVGVERVDPARIISKCDVRNVRSERVMQRIGLRRAGAVAEDARSQVVYRWRPTTS